MANYSSPYLEINDERVFYLPTTLNVDQGRGNFNVRSVTSGAGQTSTVQTRDDTTRVSRVEFTLIPTDSAFANEADWSRLTASPLGVTIRIGDGDPNARNSAGTYTRMRLTDSRTFESGPDSSVTLVFMGDPVQ